MEVAWGVAGHKSDKGIAQIMGCTQRTARAHREELYRRLNCHDREELLICVAKAAVIAKTEELTGPAPPPPPKGPPAR